MWLQCLSCCVSAWLYFGPHGVIPLDHNLVFDLSYSAKPYGCWRTQLSFVVSLFFHPPLFPLLFYDLLKCPVCFYMLTPSSSLQCILFSTVGSTLFLQLIIFQLRYLVQWMGGGRSLVFKLWCLHMFLPFEKLVLMLAFQRSCIKYSSA